MSLLHLSLSLLIKSPQTLFFFFLAKLGQVKTLQCFQFLLVWGVSLSCNSSAPVTSPIPCYRITYRITQESFHRSHTQVRLVVALLHFSGNLDQMIQRHQKDKRKDVLIQGVLRAGSQYLSIMWAQSIENSFASSCWDALIFVLMGRSYSLWPVWTSLVSVYTSFPSWHYLSI